MEIDGVRTRMGSDVVHAAQEVIGVLMHLVCRASRQNRRPAGSDFVRVVTDPEELQNSRHDAVHRRYLCVRKDKWVRESRSRLL